MAVLSGMRSSLSKVEGAPDLRERNPCSIRPERGVGHSGRKVAVPSGEYQSALEDGAGLIN